MKCISVRWVTKNPAQKLSKLQSRIKIKPYFCNYSHFLFNPTNYLKCESRILDFSALHSITLLYLSFSKGRCALIAHFRQPVTFLKQLKGETNPDLNHPFSMTFPGVWVCFHLLCSRQTSVCSRLHAQGCDSGQQPVVQVSLGCWAGQAQGQLLCW